MRRRRYLVLASTIGVSGCLGATDDDADQREPYDAEDGFLREPQPPSSASEPLDVPSPITSSLSTTSRFTDEPCPDLDENDPTCYHTLPADVASYLAPIIETVSPDVSTVDFLTFNRRAGRAGFTATAPSVYRRQDDEWTPLEVELEADHDSARPTITPPERDPVKFTLSLETLRDHLETIDGSYVAIVNARVDVVSSTEPASLEPLLARFDIVEPGTGVRLKAGEPTALLEVRSDSPPTDLGGTFAAEIHTDESTDHPGTVAITYWAHESVTLSRSKPTPLASADDELALVPIADLELETIESYRRTHPTLDGSLEHAERTLHHGDTLFEWYALAPASHDDADADGSDSDWVTESLPRGDHEFTLTYDFPEREDTPLEWDLTLSVRDPD